MDTRETQYQVRSTKQSGYTITSDGGRRGDERNLPVKVGHRSPIEAGLLVRLACAVIERNGGGRLEESRNLGWALTRCMGAYAN